MKFLLRFLLCALFIGSGWKILVYMQKTRARVDRTRPARVPLAVRVQPLVPGRLVPTIRGHGTVRPRATVHLVVQVPGTVTFVAPSFQDGGACMKDDVLIRLDPREFRLAVDQARARVDELAAQLDRLRRDGVRLTERLALAKETVTLQQREVDRQRDLHQRHATTPADLDRAVMSLHTAQQARMDLERLVDLVGPQQEQVEAQLASARAQVELARIQLEKTELRAPFDGLVLDASVEPGQAVMAGTTLGSLGESAVFEVLARVPFEDLAWLGSTDRPGGLRALEIEGLPATVELASGVPDCRWDARLVGLSGQIDPQTRTAGLILEIPDPMAPGVTIPLLPGSFVEVTLPARPVESSLLIPAHAVHEGDTLLLADAGDRLLIQPVTLLRRDQAAVLVAADGIPPGARLVLTDLQAPVPGQELAVLSGPDPTPGSGKDAEQGTPPGGHAARAAGPGPEAHRR